MKPCSVHTPPCPVFGKHFCFQPFAVSQNHSHTRVVSALGCPYPLPSPSESRGLSPSRPSATYSAPSCSREKGLFLAAPSLVLLPFCHSCPSRPVKWLKPPAFLPPSPFHEAARLPYAPDRFGQQVPASPMGRRCLRTCRAHALHPGGCFPLASLLPAMFCPEVSSS